MARSGSSSITLPVVRLPVVTHAANDNSDPSPPAVQARVAA